jgi:hypothetical protein
VSRFGLGWRWKGGRRRNEHRVITVGVGHNLTQEAPAAFTQA